MLRRSVRQGHFRSNQSLLRMRLRLKYSLREESEILNLLTHLGRLMGAIRNADVTMYSDEQIELYARAFLSGSSSPVETVTKSQHKNLAKGDK